MKRRGVQGIPHLFIMIEKERRNGDEPRRDDKNFG